MKILKKVPEAEYNNATTSERDAFAIALGGLIGAAYNVQVDTKIDVGPYAQSPKIRVDMGNGKIYKLTVTRSMD